MSRHARARPLALLGIGVWLLAGAWAAARQAAPAHRELLEVVKDLEAGKKADPAKLRAIRARYEQLHDVAWVYKPSRRGGLGPFGPGANDGIEAAIQKIALGRRAPDAAAVKRMTPGLLRAAHVQLAMAELVRLYAPARPVMGKTAREWNRYNDDLRKASLEMVAATKAADGPRLKKALEEVHAACSACHRDFRH